jgi:P27 family predicted phage terminase small subunit
MARKPKSKAEHKLRGNPSRIDLNRDHVAIKPASIRVPTWLDKTGKALWKKLAPELKSKGLLTLGDVEAFACLCQSYSDYRDAVAILRKEGKTVIAGSGGVKPHPALSEQKRSFEAFTNLAKEFGLTPKSRSAITLAAVEDDDEFEAFNKGA